MQEKQYSSSLIAMLWCQMTNVFDVNNIIAQVMSFLVSSNGYNAQNLRMKITTLETTAQLNV